MKSSTVILGVSLVFNALLAAAFLSTHSARRGDAGSAAASAKTSAASGQVSSTSGSSGPGSSSAGGTAAATPATIGPVPTWDLIHTDDLPTLVNRLRAAGFPNRVIASILQSLVWDKISARLYELQRSDYESPYWQQTKYSYSDPKVGPEIRRIYREQTALIEKLLGENSTALQAEWPEGAAYLKAQYGNLSLDKIAQIAHLAESFNDQRQTVYGAASGGMFTAADGKKVDEINKAFHAELAKVLSPDELLEYDLHASDTANNMRFNLMTAFPATEAEFRAIFPLYQEFNDKFGSNYGSLTPEQQVARTAAETELRQKAATLLTPDRAADFQIATDPRNYQTAKLLNRLELPLATATQLNAIQDATQKQANTIRRDNTTDQAAKATQIAALTQSSAAQLTQILGAQGYEAYRQTAGTWIGRLQPPAAAKK